MVLFLHYSQYTLTVSDLIRNRKIPLKEVLSDIKSEDLRTFIFNYAKKDKGFEVALKAHFISRITLADQDKKYQSILGELIKPKTIANSKIGPTNRKIITVVLHDFTQQMADLLSTDDYMEAFYIIKNSLTKIAYLQNQFNLNDKSIESYRLDFIGGLRHILQEDIAPGFRSQIESAFLEIVLKSYYLPRSENIVTELNEAGALSKKDKEKLIDNLKDKITRGRTSPAINSTLLQVAHPFPMLASAVLQDLNATESYHVLKEILREGKSEIVSFYLNTPELNIHTHKFQKELRCLFHLTNKEYTELTTALQSIEYDPTNAGNFHEILSELNDHYLEREFANLQPWADQLPFSFRSLIYSKSGAYLELIRILVEESDFQWLKVYDTVLIEAGYQNEVKEMYHTITHQYLTEHLGSQAREYIVKLEKRLTSISQTDMLFDIKERLLDAFGHRDSFSIF